MINVNEALDIILSTSKRNSVEELGLSKALNFVLAEDVISPINMPPFSQSAMDGYALHMTSETEFKLIGEIKAGDESDYELKEGEAVRIFTGGMVPKGANTVAKQEIVERDNEIIRLTETIKIPSNIRPEGEQIKSGEVALQSGTLLSPGAIGHIATLGITSVKVFKKCSVAVLTTGNELIQPGTPLTPGQIYESNSIMLHSALQEVGYDAQLFTVKDDYTSTKNAIEQAMNTCDMLLITGGISVGDYDFVQQALTELEVNQEFYKIKQKPGKPLYYGTKADKQIFALPGNPASALTCFYVYAITALRAREGQSHARLPIRKCVLDSHFNKRPSLTHFLKAKVERNHVSILNAQSSAMLASFAEANALLITEEGKDEWRIGEQVEVLMLP